MDVVDADQAPITAAAEARRHGAGRVPAADIRRDGRHGWMSDPAMVKGIQEAVTIPVMAKARIGHFAKPQVLEGAGGLSCIDQSEVLTPADETHRV